MLNENKSKREELKTYSALGLKRTLKSASQRRLITRRGAQMVLGTGQTDEPEILVRRDVYRQTRMEVLAEFLLSAKKAKVLLSREALLDHLAPRVEKETYRRLLDQKLSISRVQRAFQLTHDRRPTQAEHQLLAGPLTSPNSEPPLVAPEIRWREDLLAEVLSAVEGSRQNSSTHLQSAWTEVVGVDAAQQSTLEKVDSGTAWFRCFNSALSYLIQRRPDYPAKLARKLGLPVRLIKISY